MNEVYKRSPVLQKIEKCQIKHCILNTYMLKWIDASRDRMQYNHKLCFLDIFWRKGHNIQ